MELREGQWFNLPRAECPALNFRGAEAAFSIVAWVKRAPKSVLQCQAVAGMWNETVETRQYCMFIDLHIWDRAGQVCGHVSSPGAPSPGYKYCMEATIGATALPLGEWQQVAFTFDGTWAQVYVDGRLDYRPGLNPYYWPCAINDGGADGSDFTVGAVFRSGEMGNWFTGRLGGLAVYDKALDVTAVARLHAARDV
ncbi:MAG: LamG-like jellyroll fold domain-containing protein [Opitutaceae bacterium]